MAEVGVEAIVRRLVDFPSPSVSESSDLYHYGGLVVVVVVVVRLHPGREIVAKLRGYPSPGIALRRGLLACPSRTLRPGLESAWDSLDLPTLIGRTLRIMRCSQLLQDLLRGVACGDRAANQIAAVRDTD